jgi:hemoglobin/transferrin/lactoferrin receptor protein
MTHVRRVQHSLRLLVVLLAGSYAGVVSGQTSDVPPKENPPAAEKKSEATDSSTEVKTNAAVVEKITVTAERFERLIDLTPQSVTVMDAKEIHARPMSNVQTMLDDAPGISLQRSGALDSQIVVRGLSSNDSRIVLFIDGDRFRGRNFLEYSLLDPNEIERIEIIRGPAASLYGSDAMNGLVNVITRRAVGDVTQSFSLTPRLYSLGYASTNNLAAGRLELQGLGNGFDMLIAGNYRKAQNYDTPQGEVLNSDFAARGLTARVGYSPSATRRFELKAKIFSDDAGRANSPGAPLVFTREDPLRERALRLAFTQSQVAPWLQDVDSSLYVRKLSSILRSELHTALNGNVEFRNTWVIGPTETGGKLLARSIVGNSVLSYGVDFYNEDAPSFEDDDRIVNRAGVTTFFDPRAKRVRDAKQTVAGALAHYDWDPSSQWTVSLGGRYDFVETKISATPAPREPPSLSAAFAKNLTAHDTALTGSAGLIFRPTQILQFVGNVSTAFRTPTTSDKSGSGIVGALNSLPNANIKPESSVNYEVGARLRLPQGPNVNLTAFRSDYKDLIQFQFLDPLTRIAVNFGKAKVEGWELDGSYAMTKELAWRFNAADVRATNRITGVPLSYVPPLNGLLGVRNTWPNSTWLELTARWSDDKTRINPTQERPTDGYAVFSLYGGVDLGRYQSSLKSYRLTIGLDNLTNKAYRSPATKESLGFPRSYTNPLLEPGRSLSINVTAGF